MCVMVQVWCKGVMCDLIVMVVELQVDIKVVQCIKGVQFDNSQQGLGKLNVLGLVVVDLFDGVCCEFKMKSGVEVQVFEGLVVCVGI